MICSRVRRGLLGGCMDVLSEVLKVVKLQGALFYNAEFSSPWSVYAASSSALPSAIAQRALKNATRSDSS